MWRKNRSISFFNIPNDRGYDRVEYELVWCNVSRMLINMVIFPPKIPPKRFMHILLSLFSFFFFKFLFKKKGKKNLFCSIISSSIRTYTYTDEKPIIKILLSSRPSGIRETVENLKTIRIMRTRGTVFPFRGSRFFRGETYNYRLPRSRLHNSMDRRSGHTCWKHSRRRCV